MLALNPDLAKILNLQTRQNQGPQTRPLAAPRRVFPAIPSNDGGVAGGGALLLKIHFGTPWKINMEPENIWKWPNWKGKSSSKPSMFGFHANFQGCSWLFFMYFDATNYKPHKLNDPISMKHQGTTSKVIGKHLASIVFSQLCIDLAILEWAWPCTVLWRKHRASWPPTSVE